MSGEHSRSKTSAIIAMYNVLTTRVFVRYKTSYIAIIVLVLLRECSPLTTVDKLPCYMSHVWVVQYTQKHVSVAYK